MKRQLMTLTALALGVILLAAGLFAGCGQSAPTTAKAGTQAKVTTSGKSAATTAKAATTAAKSDSRIDDLLAAWNKAEIKAQLKETGKSSTLNAMYGCISQHVVILEEQQFMVLEFKLSGLNGTARNFLDFIDKNGYNAKNDDPAWHNQEFVLLNAYSLLESGEVKAKYAVKTHPKSAVIISTFQVFK